MIETLTSWELNHEFPFGKKKTPTPRVKQAMCVSKQAMCSTRLWGVIDVSKRYSEANKSRSEVRFSELFTNRWVYVYGFCETKKSAG
jgi:hypothetical protein